MMRLTYILISFFVLFSCCKEKSGTTIENNEPYFEGEIKLTESQGIYGSLFKTHTSYFLSENRLKREQKLGGLNSIMNSSAGIIIDLEKDSVILYYSDRINGKFKHSTTLKNYKSILDSVPQQLPSPVDRTFTLLPSYKLIRQKKDSLEIKGFSCDYTFFKDSLEILKQEVFDTKEIKVKRELLEMVFVGLPKDINFPLKSEINTTITEFSNDSIVSGKQTKEFDKFIRNFMRDENSTEPEKKTDLDKISENKWVEKGLNILKKGVDLSIRIVMEVSDLNVGKLSEEDISLPSGDFMEIPDFGDFILSIPQESNYDFDD